MAARLNLEASWAQGLKLKLKKQVARMRGASGQAAEPKESLNPPAIPKNLNPFSWVFNNLYLLYPLFTIPGLWTSILAIFYWHTNISEDLY